MESEEPQAFGSGDAEGEGASVVGTAIDGEAEAVGDCELMAEGEAVLNIPQPHMRTAITSRTPPLRTRFIATTTRAVIRR